MGAFSRAFIQRPILALVISIVIVIAGSISIFVLPVESMPDITPPTVSIATSFPGANASVLEETVAAPIEQQVNGVEGMLYMSSISSSAGSYSLTVTFEIGTDPDIATVLTQNRVSIAEPALPEEVRRQGITVKKRSTNMVLMVGLTSPDGQYDDVFLSNYATIQLKDALARTAGVGEVQVFGARDFGMRVWLDPGLLRSRGLTSEDVVNALRAQNVQPATGAIGQSPIDEGQSFEYTLTTQGRFTDASDFEEIIVRRGEDGELVRVRDVARVELGAQAYSWYAQQDGESASLLGIYQTPGANALSVKEGVLATLREAEASFPEGLEWQVTFDSTDYITESIREVMITLLQAIVLVVLTVFVFLQDARTTLIPAITIPVSLIGTFGALLAMGFSINNLTLFGLVLAIGIVVDDSIVVVENATRLIDDEGLDPKDATARAMDEVAGPIVATTLVLLAVFVPTMFMPGLTGRLYNQFATTISIATLLSSLNALTLAPALSGILLRPSPDNRGRFFTAFNRAFERVTDRYVGRVGALIGRPRRVVAVFAVLLAVLVVGVSRIPFGFLPTEDQGSVMINVELPSGASLERTREVMDRVTEIVLALPSIRAVGVVGGYSVLNGVQGPNYGFAAVAFDPWSERDVRLNDYLGAMAREFSQIQEATVFAFPPPSIAGLGSADGFQMELQDRGGLGVVGLESVARGLVAEGEQSPVLTRLSQNLNANVPQIFVDVDREKVQRLDIPLPSVFATLAANLGSAYVNDFNLFGRTWRVMAQADNQFRRTRDDIGRLEVRSNSGAMIPISTIAETRDTVGPLAVNRFNLFPSVTLSGVAAPGFSSGQANDEIEAIANRMLPAQVGFEWSGVTQQEKAAGNLAPLIFTLAFLFGYLFLAAQYESWSLALAVMLSVPLGILGAVTLTGVWGLDINTYTQIGFVLLIGLSAKTAILIVEFAKVQRDGGATTREAALTAAKLRFRPVLMTALSFVLGVLPLVVASGAGAASRQSLGVAVFGGMSTSTVLGIFFIPLFYFIVQSVVERDGTA